MTDYAVDTNVLSELAKPAPHPPVIAFLAKSDDTFWVPAIVVFEMEYGVTALPQGRRRRELDAAIGSILANFNNRILPLERAGAEWAARYRAQRHSAGRDIDVSDALIAGIAKAHNLPLATRNIRHFDGLDIPIVNPWTTP